MNFKKDISNAGDVLVLEGELTIHHSNELKEALKDLQDTTDNLLLNLEGVTAADLSCLQLLCSAHRSSLKTNKEIKLTGDIPVMLKQMATDAGFIMEACRTDAGGSCLWKKIRGES